MICFLGKITFNDFVRYHLGEEPGDIVERETGKVLGSHQGFWFHTIGQRKGLGLSQGPWYVVGKDIDNNVVTVSHSHHLGEHARDTFEVTAAHWVHGPPGREHLTAKLRHSEVLYDCRVESKGEERFAVTLDRPDAGVAPGQFAVFYDGEECLGGARIV